MEVEMDRQELREFVDERLSEQNAGEV